jgi:hypothetical protein
MSDRYKYTSSKGNQIKHEKDGIWYKLDFLGYEGLAETVCSELLAYTNITEYVSYQMCKIPVGSTESTGCSSEDFLKVNEEIITADRLFKIKYGAPAQQMVYQYNRLSDRIKYFVDEIGSMTGIAEYGKKLTHMLEWDAFVLNDDRHFNNIAFVLEGASGSFRECPLFDNGAAFMSDLRFDYPIDKNVIGMIPDVQSKPFSSDFDRQVEACRQLYGAQLQIRKDVDISEQCKVQARTMYGVDVLQRVLDIFQLQKYNCDCLR